MGEPGTKDPLSLEELDAVVGLRTGRKHALSILVENKPGVLTRIAGLFARRGFNIDTLTVGPTDDDGISRITLTLDGALHPIDQVTKQLHKLVNVLKIRDLEPEDTVSRELALFKVSADGAQRAEVHADLRDLPRQGRRRHERSIIVEITGTTDKIEAFEEMVRPFGLVEMMRTGEIAISRGRGRNLTASGANVPDAGNRLERCSCACPTSCVRSAASRPTPPRATRRPTIVRSATPSWCARRESARGCGICALAKSSPTDGPLRLESPLDGPWSSPGGRRCQQSNSPLRKHRRPGSPSSGFV